MYLPDPNEEMHRSVHQPTIHVIERAEESYNEYHERKKREESKKRVPFGFARALEES